MELDDPKPNPKKRKEGELPPAPVETKKQKQASETGMDVETHPMEDIADPQPVYPAMTPEQLAQYAPLNQILQDYLVQGRNMSNHDGWEFIPNEHLNPTIPQHPATDPLVVNQAPQLLPPNPQFELLRQHVDRVVPEEFEQWHYETNKQLVYYEAEKDYKGNFIELDDDDLALLKADASSVIYAPLVTGSLKADASNDTVNKPLSLVFHFIDVGQGSGTLVECPHGEWILFDLGTAKCGQSEGSSVVSQLIAFIKSKTKTLDYLIISHADKDHISLLHELGTSVQINKVLLGGVAKDYEFTRKPPKKASKSPPPKGLMETFMDFLVAQEISKIKKLGRDASGVNEHSVVKESLINAGKPYTEDPGKPRDQCLVQAKDVDIWVVSANAPANIGTALLKSKLGLVGEIDAGTPTNSSSVVLCFQYKGEKVIISADATFCTDYQILHSPTSKWKGHLKCYGVSGGHHGSRQSFSPAMLKELDPEWVHFSADMMETFGHPEWVLVKRVTECCPKIFKKTAWGPHGVVVGKAGALEFDATVVQSLDDVLKILIGNRQSLADKFPKLAITFRHVLATKAWMMIDARNHKFMSEGQWQRKELKDIATQSKKALDEFDASLQNEPTADEIPADWWVEVFKEVDRWRRETPNLLKMTEEAWVAAMTEADMPITHYWGVRFQQMSDELDRISKIDFSVNKKKTDTWWQWFTTQANIFTTLETANEGVYWRLEIDSNGKPHTDRT